MTALKVDGTRQGPEIPPRGGAKSALVDFLSALGRGVFAFVVWFFIGGLVSDSVLLFDRRRVAFYAMMRLLVVVAFVVVATFGLAHPALAFVGIGTMVSLGLYGFLARSYARDLLYEAATRDVGKHAPLPESVVNAPAILEARSIQRLAVAVDRVRRRDVAGALRALDELDEGALSADELRMVRAVRALARSMEGDRKGAALLSLAAFPTGALAVDALLAPICVEAAWPDGLRLSSLVTAWQARGIDEGDATALGQWVRISQVRLGHRPMASLPDDDRRAVEAFAETLGDHETLALARAIPPPSSGYR